MKYHEGFQMRTQSSSSIMNKLTDLFCLTIFFAKFIILVSFILHFLENIEGYTPTRFSKGARGLCPAP